MPLEIPHGTATMLVRKDAFERASLSRAAIDERLGLTADEFRVEGSVIAIGPIEDGDVSLLIDELERAGLVYFDDFAEMSGNWPPWILVYARGAS